MNMIGLSWMAISGSLLLVVLAGVAAYWQVLRRREAVTALQICQSQLEQHMVASHQKDDELRELSAGLRAEKAHVEQLQRQVEFAQQEAGRLIIDAKVSLNAYTRYINAEDDAERRMALAEHVTAVGQRIKELSDRSYFDLPGLNAPEMVFMFVPIESAFVEALKADETLFQKAIEQNVLVATPTTLLTSLNIVRQLWRFEDQNKHTAELAERAGKVYDKLRTFLSSMDAIGHSLDRAQDAYKKACDQLVSGKANLVKQVSDFRQLGVAVKGELNEVWVDRADLELNLISQMPAEQQA